MINYFTSHASHISVVLFVLAIIQAMYASYMVRFGTRTTGTVIRIASDNEGDTPIVGFSTPDQQTHEFRVKTVRGSDHWFIGKTCPVLYDPRNPKRAHVDEPLQRWMMFYILLGANVMVLFLSRFLSYLPPAS